MEKDDNDSRLSPSSQSRAKPNLNFRHVGKDWFDYKANSYLPSPTRWSDSTTFDPVCQPSTSKTHPEVKQEVEEEEDDEIQFIAHFKERQVPINPNRKRRQNGAGSDSQRNNKQPRLMESSTNPEESREYIDITDMISISAPERTYSKSLKMETLTYPLLFTPRAVEYAGPFEELLDMAVTALFKEASYNRQESDLFGIDFWWPGMPDAKFITFRPIASFDPSAVRLEMHKILQSNSPNVEFTQQGRVSFVIVENALVGSGRAAHDGGGSEGSNITPVPGTDLCLPKAIVLGKAYSEGGSQGSDFRSFRRSPSILEKEALKLMKLAGVNKRSDYGAAELEKFQMVLTNHQIKVIREGSSMKPVWQGPYKGNDDKNIIAIRLHKKHYDHIKRLAPFFKNYYYCNACDKAYSHPEDHYVCSVRCKRCWHCNTSDCDGTESLTCADCRMTFKSHNCLKRHRTIIPGRNDKRKSACTENKLCADCDEPIYERTGARSKHVCGTKHCRTCSEKRPIDHSDCYQRTLKNAEEKFQARTIFFDLESRFEEAEDGKIIHKANLCVAYKCCRLCWHDTPLTIDDVPERCEVCNDDRLKIWSAFDDPDIDPVACFIDWLDEQQHVGYTLVAHNLKGYDGHFLMREVLSQSDELVSTTYTDEPIIAGRKINMATAGRARAVDSHNFIPCALSAFTKMFDLGERKKGWRIRHFIPRTLSSL